MSTFHCPIGAALPGDSTCINCGLCGASTKQEYEKSIKIVKKYLYEINSARTEKYRISKIAVCGKGGTGKSTITTYMAKSLVDLGYRVIIIDMDESNPFISKRLELSNPTSLIKINEFDDDLSRNWMIEDIILFDDIPDEFISKNASGEIGVMCAGKIESAFQGCACTMSAMMGEFLRKIRLSNKEIILIDNEAGVEGFGRGIEKEVDAVLDIVIPTMDSVLLSERISELSRELGVKKVWSIVNQVPSDDLKKLIIKEMNNRGIRYLGLLDKNFNLMAETFGEGKMEDTDFKEKILKLTKLMLDECEMEY